MLETLSGAAAYCLLAGRQCHPQPGLLEQPARTGHLVLVLQEHLSIGDAGGILNVLEVLGALQEPVSFEWGGGVLNALQGRPVGTLRLEAPASPPTHSHRPAGS